MMIEYAVFVVMFAALLGLAGCGVWVFVQF